MDSYEITLDDKLKLVRVKAAGSLRQADGEKLITLAREKAGEKGFHILYDIRRATTVVPFASWFNLPRKLEVFKAETAWKIKAAVLASADDKAMKGYNFYETVTENLGFSVRIFTDEEKALAWLLGGSAKTGADSPASGEALQHKT